MGLSGYGLHFITAPCMLFVSFPGVLECFNDLFLSYCGWTFKNITFSLLFFGFISFKKEQHTFQNYWYFLFWRLSIIMFQRRFFDYNISRFILIYIKLNFHGYSIKVLYSVYVKLFQMVTFMRSLSLKPMFVFCNFFNNSCSCLEGTLSFSVRWNST